MNLKHFARCSSSAVIALFSLFAQTWVSIQEGDLTETGILRVALSAGLSYGVLNWIFHSVSGACSPEDTLISRFMLVAS